MNYDHYGVTIINLQCQDYDHALQYCYLTLQIKWQNQGSGLNPDNSVPFGSPPAYFISELWTFLILYITKVDCGPFCWKVVKFYQAHNPI
jgi:hypothetical protein